MTETFSEIEYDVIYDLYRGGRMNDFEGVVPKDSYFVLGDNRNQSRDSRIFGFVPEGDLVGSVIVE